MKKIILTLALLLMSPLAGESIYLRENLARGEAGDFIVTSQNRNYTLFHVFSKSPDRLVIEEITIPSSRMPKGRYSWRGWVESGAPQHTSWVIYRVNLDSGELEEQYSFTNQQWCDVAKTDSFLSTLLNLRLEKVSPRKRKKVGRSTKIWNPQMVVDSRTIDGVQFDAWKTRWPQDRSELSGKTIEVFVPEENEKYPSYFPYWLQISGVIGKAKVRIVDSGSGLQSPKQLAN